MSRIGNLCYIGDTVKLYGYGCRRLFYSVEIPSFIARVIFYYTVIAQFGKIIKENIDITLIAELFIIKTFAVGADIIIPLSRISFTCFFLSGYKLYGISAFNLHGDRSNASRGKIRIFRYETVIQQRILGKFIYCRIGKINRIICQNIKNIIVSGIIGKQDFIAVSFIPNCNSHCRSVKLKVGKLRIILYFTQLFHIAEHIAEHIYLFIIDRKPCIILICPFVEAFHEIKPIGLCLYDNFIYLPEFFGKYIFFFCFFFGACAAFFAVFAYQDKNDNANA